MAKFWLMCFLCTLTALGDGNKTLGLTVCLVAMLGASLRDEIRLAARA